MADRRHVTITGVSRGLGRALAVRLLRDGHRVSGCARTGDALRELAESASQTGRFTEVDITDDAAVARWIDDLTAWAGPPDLLVNNAARINRSAPLWEVDRDDFDAVVDVNLKGVANVLRHALPPMLERGSGVIVNMSSGWGRSVSPEVAPYCATKYAIEGLTQALALELPTGLAAVPVNPGIIDTAMLRSYFGGSASAYEDAEAWAERAAPFLLGLGPRHNGRSLDVPG